MRCGERRPCTIATVTGKKHRYIAIAAFGATPLKPRLPRITSTIGAIASTGTVCDATTHGSSARSMPQVVAIRSNALQPGWFDSTRSIAPCAFKPMQPAYQTSSVAPSTVATGSALFIAAMAERLAQFVRHRDEVGRVAQAEVA